MTINEKSQDDLIFNYLVKGLDFVSDVAAAVPEAKWNAQSPCDDWTAKQVLGHLITVNRVGVAILEGRQPDWSLVPAEIHGDPAQEWNELAKRVKRDLEDADPAQEIPSPKGVRTIAQGMNFPMMDLYLHAWDIGASAGIDVVIPDDVIAYIRTQYGKLDPVRLRTSGTLGAEQPAPPDATATQSLMAYTGRTL